MATMVYQWGRMKHAVPAQVVGETVAAIQRRDGVCQPSCLVEEARDENNPIHPLFTWDDGEAAERWRTHEARNVINSLCVTIAGHTKPLPAFVSVSLATADEPARGYQPIGIVRQRDDWRAQALSDALRQLNGLRQRYEALETLSPVWRALDDVAATAAPRSAAAD